MRAHLITIYACERDSERAITLGMPNEAFAEGEHERVGGRGDDEDISEMIRRIREQRPDVYAHLLALLKALNSSEC